MPCWHETRSLSLPVLNSGCSRAPLAVNEKLKIIENDFFYTNRQEISAYPPLGSRRDAGARPALRCVQGLHRADATKGLWHFRLAGRNDGLWYDGSSNCRRGPARRRNHARSDHRAQRRTAEL